MARALLPSPALVDPPHCACEGKRRDMREHTRDACNSMTTDEINGAMVWALVQDDLRASDNGPITHHFGRKGAEGHMVSPDCVCRPTLGFSRKSIVYDHHELP